MEKRLLPVKDASIYLGVSTHLLYKMAARREISHVKIRGKLLFDLRQLDAFIDGCSVERTDWKVRS